MVVHQVESWDAIYSYLSVVNPSREGATKKDCHCDQTSDHYAPQIVGCPN